MNAKKDLYVTFDLWETLLIDKPELDEARNRMRYEGLHKALLDSGIEIRLQDLKKGYEQSSFQLQAIWRGNKELSTIEQIQIITSATGLDFSVNAELARTLERAYVDPIFAVPPELNGDAPATLLEIRGRVRGIGLISNTGRSPGMALRELLRKYGIIESFDATIFSDEASSRKPDRTIFEKAATALGAELSKIVHIGDDPEADVWGAKNAGMKAVLFDYPVPEGFKKRPGSLFALSRSDRRIPDSDIRPDGKINSLKEFPDFIDSLN